MLYKNESDRAGAVVWEESAEYARNLCEHTGVRWLQGNPEAMSCHCGGTGVHPKETKPCRLRFLGNAHGKHGRQPRRPKGAASIRHAYA